MAEARGEPVRLLVCDAVKFKPALRWFLYHISIERFSVMPSRAGDIGPESHQEGPLRHVVSRLMELNERN